MPYFGPPITFVSFPIHNNTDYVAVNNIVTTLVRNKLITSVKFDDYEASLIIKGLSKTAKDIFETDEDFHDYWLTYKDQVKIRGGGESYAGE